MFQLNGGMIVLIASLKHAATTLGMWDRILAKIKMSNDKTLQGNLIKNEVKSYITEP
jgi:hypothetical protein